MVLKKTFILTNNGQFGIGHFGNHFPANSMHEKIN